MNILRPVVKTEVGTQCKTLDGLNVDVAITKDTPHLQTVVAVVIKLAKRVLTVAHPTYRTREGNAVLFIDRYCGRHLQCVLQRLTVNLVRIGNRSILANGDHLVHLVAGVDTTGEALKVGVLQDTVVLLVSEREES